MAIATERKGECSMAKPMPSKRKKRRTIENEIIECRLGNTKTLEVVHCVNCEEPNYLHLDRTGKDEDQSCSVCGKRLTMVEKDVQEIKGDFDCDDDFDAVRTVRTVLNDILPNEYWDECLSKYSKGYKWRSPQVITQIASEDISPSSSNILVDQDDKARTHDSDGGFFVPSDVAKGLEYAIEQNIALTKKNEIELPDTNWLIGDVKKVTFNTGKVQEVEVTRLVNGCWKTEVKYETE
jgi:hypothetical protein